MHPYDNFEGVFSVNFFVVVRFIIVVETWIHLNTRRSSKDSLSESVSRKAKVGLSVNKAITTICLIMVEIVATIAGRKLNKITIE